MDNVIRRQSEQLDNNYRDNNDSDANYDYRKWEWGYLRVGFSFVDFLLPFYEQTSDLKFSDGVPEFGTGITLHHIRDEVAEELPVDILGYSHINRHCAHRCIGCNTKGLSVATRHNALRFLNDRNVFIRTIYR